jgi:DNA polymerase-1
MKKVEEELKKAGILDEVRMVLQVHDELVYEIKKDKLETASKIIKKGMIDVIPDQFLVGMVPVPLDVTVGFGKNWGELK